MKSIYNPQLVNAAAELLTNEGFSAILTDYLENLKTNIMDSTDPQEILMAHKEHASIVSFAEYIQMLGDKPIPKHKGPKEYV